MKEKQKEKAVKSDLTAPCGLDCFNCVLFAENIVEEVRAAVAARTGLAPEEVPCRGCIPQNGHCPWMRTCETFQCTLEHGVRFCFECPDFPCARLQPAADRADTYPHNLKLYNLCRIRGIGLERWAGQEAASIRARYFGGKLVVGAGPVIGPDKTSSGKEGGHD